MHAGGTECRPYHPPCIVAFTVRHILPELSRKWYNYSGESRGVFEPSVPAGYDYDACNAEVLLMRMSVREGRIVLPDGMSYRLLILPQTHRMTPAVLQKLTALIKEGAAVYGPKPTLSPSLAAFRSAIRKCAAAASGAGVWGRHKPPSNWLAFCVMWLSTGWTGVVFGAR